jgi:hypothetical protein
MVFRQVYERWRIWDAFNPGAIWLWLGIPLGAALAALLIVLIVPRGAAQQTTGTIEQIHVTESEMGSGLVAFVRTGHGSFTVALNGPSYCKVGDTIALRERNTLLGRIMSVDGYTIPLCQRSAKAPS